MTSRIPEQPCSLPFLVPRAASGFVTSSLYLSTVANSPVHRGPLTWTSLTTTVDHFLIDCWLFSCLRLLPRSWYPSSPPPIRTPVRMTICLYGQTVSALTATSGVDILLWTWWLHLFCLPPNLNYLDEALVGVIFSNRSFISLTSGSMPQYPLALLNQPCHKWGQLFPVICGGSK